MSKKGKTAVLSIAIILVIGFLFGVVFISKVIPPGEEWISYQNDEVIQIIDAQLQGIDMESVVKEKSGYIVEKSIHEIQQEVEKGNLSYEEIQAHLPIGCSEIDVGDIMMEECAKRNVITAFGNPPEYPLVLLVKGGMSHRKPNAKNICLPGDMLVIDFSIRFNGYTSDIARTMYFLKPGEEHAPKEVTDCANGAIRAVGEVMKVIDRLFDRT